MTRPPILIAGRMLPSFEQQLTSHFDLHRVASRDDLEALLARDDTQYRGLAGGIGGFKIDASLIDRLPSLEIIAHFGVGYDGVDAKHAAEKGVIVTNTPDVLTEEVADTAIGLLLMTVRELSAAERHLRDGKWPSGAFRLTGTLRDRSVGIVGLGRIGETIAQRLEAFGLPVAYHNRRPKAGTGYRYYADLVAMAKDVDTLISVLPGGPTTDRLIGKAVLEALGPRGVLINIGRGTVVDEAALIEALSNRTIQAAGLDVFEKEPQVPAALIALDNAVLLPHVGSASLYTRDQMAQRVIDNLLAWAEGKPPLSPVPETPFKGWKASSRS